MFKNQISSIHDSDSFNFTDTIDIMNSLKGGAVPIPPDAVPGATSPPTTLQALTSNNTSVAIVAVIAILYIAVNNESTPHEVIEIVDNPIFKLSILGAIIYLSKSNPMISLVAIVIFCLTIQTLQQKTVPAIVDVEDDEIAEEIDEIIASELANNKEEEHGVHPSPADDSQLSDVNAAIGNTLTQANSELTNIMDDSSDNISGIIDDASNNIPSVDESSIQMSNMLDNVSNNASDMVNNSMDNIQVNNDSNMMNDISNSASNMMDGAANMFDNIGGFSDSAVDNFEQL